MPLEMPDPSDTAGGTARSQAPCRFCGTEFAAELTYCPRCGLQRGPQLAAEPVPAPAPAPAPQYQPPLYQPQYPPQVPTQYEPPMQPTLYYAPPGAPPPPQFMAPPQSAPPPGWPTAPGNYQQPGQYSSYPPPPPPERPAVRRHYGIWITAAVVAFALIVGGVFVALSQLNGGKSNHASTVTVPDGPGVIFRSSDGHFAARFPDTPKVQSIPGSIGGITFTVILAADQASRTIVECENISQALPVSLLPTNLTAAVSSSAISAGTTLISDSATIFQGSPAHQGEFMASDGTKISVIAIGYSTSRIYLVAAPTGAAFDDLLASFVPVP